MTGPSGPANTYFFVDPDHGQPAALRVERLMRSGLLLFPREQPDPGLEPLLAGHDLRQRHHDLLRRAAFQAALLQLSLQLAESCS